jgi:hypothetical protein
MAKLILIATVLSAACAASESNAIDARGGSIDARQGSVDAPGGSIDAPGGSIDAPGGSIDAPGGSAGIGSACVGTGQGSCPTGFECLSLVGGSGSWCSKTCADINDQSCSVGYSGPGFPACLLNITPAGGGAAVPHCAVLCSDEPGAPTYCPGGAAQCNGTCTTPLLCTAEIRTGGGVLQAKLCQ